MAMAMKMSKSLLAWLCDALILFIRTKFVRGGFKKKKKKLMEFSIKLAGWVLDAPVFH